MVIRFLLVLFLMPLLAFGQMATGQTRRLIVPNNLGNFTTWWKADSIPLTTNNAPVTAWNDSVGANNLSGAGATAPTIVTNASGANAGVQFDGVNDEMSMTSTLTFVRGSWTVFTVMVAGAGGMEFGSSTVNMQYQTYPQIVLFNSTDSNNPISNAYSSGTNTLVVAVVRISLGATLDCLENKTTRGTTAAGNNNYTFNRMGRWNGATVYYGGKIFEVLHYGRYLSNTECNFVYDKYLKPKYPGLP